MLTACDVWEGSLEIDEPTLLEGGVVALMIRLNDMNGGHHKDENFDNQWAQGSGFLRAPYFVYNPWNTGQENFDWLMNNLPANGVTKVFKDTEVKKPGYPAEEYADQYQRFTDLVKAEVPAATYTGAWFLPLLSHWPTNEDYWWARYPWALCPPKGRENWTWAKWSQESNQYGFHPDPNKLCPGQIRMWQASGDRLVLPGTANRPMDLNLWPNTLAELERWWGSKFPTRSLAERLDWLEQEARNHGWFIPE